jgi:hypothetical protein
MAAGGSVDILMVRGAGVSDMPAGVSDMPADYNRLHGVICHAQKLLYSHRENRKSQ